MYVWLPSIDVTGIIVGVTVPIGVCLLGCCLWWYRNDKRCCPDSANEQAAQQQPSAAAEPGQTEMAAAPATSAPLQFAPAPAQQPAAESDHESVSVAVGNY